MATSPAASDFSMVPTVEKQLLTRTAPLSASTLDGTGLSLDSITTCELGAGTELYNLASAHIAKLKGVRHFSVDIGGKKSGCSHGHCGDGDDDADMRRCAQTGLGLGMLEFECEVEGSPSRLFALHQTLGEVVGSDCGATLMRNLILISPSKDDIGLLTAFCDQLIAEADATSEKVFTTYRFHVQYQYWRKAETCAARPIESVVLPKKLKQKITDDLDGFVSKATKQWYTEHGIPYKRSMLLHGSPGSGKTSLIQALAGRYRRNVCYLSPSHPEFTDDALKAAVQRVPQRSIIVLEDVDALFANGGRTKKEGDKSALTFSGVLNALDGVGGSGGQIFMLTTNHRENLDPALIRNGRVDTHIEFTDATEEQMLGIFANFYKDAKAGLAEKFTESLRALLGERTVSCAELQHYFILMRRASAEEAAEGVKKILEEKEAHGKLAKEKEEEEAKAKEAKEKEEKEAKDKEAKDKEEAPKKEAAASSGGSGGKEVHVHVHMHGA